MQRQYTGTAGKVTNCQVGVFLAYASPKGRALIDRELYLPRSWTADQDRLASAKVPGKRGFKTKRQLLQAIIERAIAAGVPFAWGTANEAYGNNGPLRAFLEERKLGYVLAVSRDHPTATKAGTMRADALAVALPKEAWQRISCGNGAKGRRFYDWALVATDRPEISLLVRRSIARPSDLALYLCHTPQPVPLARLVQAAGARWAVEQCFQAGKNEAGLDHYQVRLYKARYVTLSMLALAWLAVTRAALAGPQPPGQRPESHLITSANEIRRPTPRTPGGGHAGGTTTRKEHDIATTSDNASKGTKAADSPALPRRPASQATGRRTQRANRRIIPAWSSGQNCCPRP